MANNSSGARSVLYGKTIDHVPDAARRCWPTARSARWRPLDGAGARRGLARRVDPGPGLPRGAGAGPRPRRRDRPPLPQGAAPRRRLQPRRVRRSGGAGRPVAADGRVGRHARLRHRGHRRPGAAAGGQGARHARVRRPARRARRDAAGPDPRPVGGRGDGRLHPRPRHAATPRSTRRCGTIVAGRHPALLCVEFYDDHLDALLPRLEALERDLRQRASRRAACAGCSTPAAQARVWHLREVVARAVDGDEGRRQGALVRRGHGGARPSGCAITSPASSSWWPATAPWPASTRTPRSAACTCGRSSTSRPRRASAQFEAIASDVADLVLEFGGALSGEHGDGLVRGAFNEQMFGSTLYQAFRTVKRTFDPAGPLQSRPDRRHAAHHLAPALRAGLPHAGSAELLRLRRRRRPRPRRRGLQRRRRVPQDAARARCARPTWRPATRRTRRAAAPTCCGWR